MTIILNTCLLRVWYLTKCCQLFRLLYVYLNFYAWKSCWSLACEFEIFLLPITAAFEVDFYLYWFTFVVTSFVPDTCLCTFAMPVNLLCRLMGCLSSRDLKMGIYDVFWVVVWNAFCSRKFGICIWPVCAKIRLPTDSLSIVPCNCFETYTVENMFCSISDSYIKLQNSFCPNP